MVGGGIPEASLRTTLTAQRGPDIELLSPAYPRGSYICDLCAFTPISRRQFARSACPFGAKTGYRFVRRYPLRTANSRPALSLPTQNSAIPNRCLQRHRIRSAHLGTAPIQS